MKTCKTCGETKPVTEFDVFKYKNLGYREYVVGSCKDCRRKRVREYGRNHRKGGNPACVPNRLIKAPEGFVVAGHGKIVRESVRGSLGFFIRRWRPTPKNKVVGHRSNATVLVGHMLMSPRQRDVYMYVKWFWLYYGYSPTYMDIAHALKLKSSQSPMKCVHRLRELGLLHKEYRKKHDVRPVIKRGGMVSLANNYNYNGYGLK